MKMLELPSSTRFFPPHRRLMLVEGYINTYDIPLPYSALLRPADLNEEELYSFFSNFYNPANYYKHENLIGIYRRFTTVDKIAHAYITQEDKASDENCFILFSGDGKNWFLPNIYAVNLTDGFVNHTCIEWGEQPRFSLIKDDPCSALGSWALESSDLEYKEWPFTYDMSEWETFSVEEVLERVKRIPEDRFLKLIEPKGNLNA